MVNEWPRIALELDKVACIACTAAAGALNKRSVSLDVERTSRDTLLCEYVTDCTHYSYFRSGAGMCVYVCVCWCLCDSTAVLTNYACLLCYACYASMSTYGTMYQNETPLAIMYTSNITNEYLTVICHN